MTIVATEHLSTGGTRLVFVHGFTQTRESWRPLARHFTNNYEVVIIDAPHHGESQNVDVDLEHASGLIAEIVGDGVCIGYSMGGRMALLAALHRHSHMQALVVISATPGIDDPQERKERQVADASLADQLVQDGTKVFLDKWLAQPMFAHLTPALEDLRARQRNSPLALAQSLRRCGTGTQLPVWENLAELTIPILLVSGEDDTKFTEIACRMYAALPQSRLEIIEGAGHSPHLEQPQAFEKILREWLLEIGC
jgi:2-succinyl-6-hydroxy-2,4-cyclohexadiene-1-carboxylate synthase